MKTLLALVFAVCILTAPGRAAPVEPAPDPELAEEAYLFEVVRHLYRWYLDETDAKKVVGKSDIEIWVKHLDPELDPGDNSRYGQIVIPALDVNVTVKKADYAIEELDLIVKTDGYKITNVARGDLPDDPGPFKVITTSYQAMREYGTRTRTQVRFPDEALLERMRTAARNQLQQHLDFHGQEMPTEPQPVHLAPVSPVANETWIFWEGGRVLLRFASDIDLENPAVWDQEDLTVDIYNIDEQTVVSLDEVAGSNAYITRDQVGRALFNCVVLGKRLMLTPRDPSDM